MVDCSSRNLSESRNLGIAASAGELIAFIDDDALPFDEEWVARYVSAFSIPGSEKVGAAGGPVWHHDTDALEFNGGATSDYGFQIFKSDETTSARLDGRRWVARVQGCNCAFRRSALVAVGGFDEFFTYYHDETDLCLRLARAGFATVHLPDNAVRHYPATSERRTSKFDRNWEVVARSDTYFALKNGDDALPVRMAKTLAFAPRKHYFREINSYFVKGEISFHHWTRLLGQWAAGLAAGVRAGLFRPRATATLGDAPEVFIPFSGDSEPRLRIALLSQTSPGQPGFGGIGRYTFDLAAALRERGHDVHVICRDTVARVHSSPGFYVHGITAAQSAPRQFAKDCPITNKNVSYGVAVVRLLKELYARGIEFDVVHASNWDSEAAALIRARAYPVVLALVSSLAQVIQTEGWEVNADLLTSVALDKWQIENADTVVAPSHGVLDSYRTLMGLDTDVVPVQRVPLGIAPDLQPLSSGAHTRRRLLFVGRCERRKGVHTLLEVLPTLLASHPDWECHLVGGEGAPQSDGKTFRQSFLDAHESTPWIGRVVFRGTVSEDELRREYQDCDLFVAPSLFESFGLIYHEAMQYGKAVVGCRTGGVPEVVEHGVEGLLVTPDSPQELHDALASLMSDGPARERMGTAGLHRVRHRQNDRTMAEEMEQVYVMTVDRAGATCRANRHRSWPQDLPVLDDSDRRVELTGSWQKVEALPGQQYRHSAEPGSALTFTARAGTKLQVTALRHDWSGILSIEIDGHIIRYADLFKTGLMEPAYTFTVGLPGTPDQTVRVSMRVHPERNPESYANQVWVKRVRLLNASRQAAAQAPH